MKAITIKQPFASLIAAGWKEYEFRTWKTHYRGDILIHAGIGFYPKAVKKFEEYGLDYPAGCILARARLTECIKVDEAFREFLRAKNALVYSGVTEEEWEGYAFKLENAEFVKPIPVKGSLGLWEYHGPIETVNLPL